MQLVLFVTIRQTQPYMEPGYFNTLTLSLKAKLILVSSESTVLEEKINQCKSNLLQF